MQVKFYRCSHCGNVALKVCDAGVPLVCCGEKMQEMVPASVDAAREKHVPAVEIDGCAVHVQIGSTRHPMSEEHRIVFVCLVTEDGYIMRPLASTDSPVADFVLGAGQTVRQVYEYCNLHGLWVADIKAGQDSDTNIEAS